MFQQEAGLPAGSGRTDVISAAQQQGKGWHQKHYTRHKTVLDVVAALTSGTGCGAVIVGEHGAGKSFIAQRALEQLGDDFLVVQVRGSSISSKLPYGALSVLLNELDSSHLEHPLMVLRGLTQLLHTRAQGRTVVLFVDNAHDLDELSTMMVAQLCAGGHVLLLAACVDLPNLGSDIMGLWKDDLLRRVDLGPFDFSETADSLAQEYGGHFSHTAARALWNASGGNALFLHSLAREQIKLGVIVRHEDSWVLGDRPVALAGEIRDVLKARLNRLSPGQRDVFELLSLAGALPLQTLMHVSKAQDIDTLQERALIRVSHEHPPMVSITNPVTAGIVASVVPPGRSAELRRRLGAVLQDLDLDEYTGSTAVAWALDCGEEVDPQSGAGGGPPREQGVRSAVGPEVYPGNRRTGEADGRGRRIRPGLDLPATTTKRPAASWPTSKSGPVTDWHWMNGPPCSCCGPSWTGGARPRPEMRWPGCRRLSCGSR